MVGKKKCFNKISVGYIRWNRDQRTLYEEFLNLDGERTLGVPNYSSLGTCEEHVFQPAECINKKRADILFVRVVKEIS